MVGAARLDDSGHSYGLQASTNGRALPSRGEVSFRVLSYNTLAEKLVRTRPGVHASVGSITVICSPDSASEPR